VHLVAYNKVLYQIMDEVITINKIVIKIIQQSKRVMQIRLPYYGTNKCGPTKLFLTINRTS
jgi:hypothetical protein